MTAPETDLLTGLQRLERNWAAQHAPIVTHLAPGLPAAEQNALLADLGLRMPAEGRIWWGWHNGFIGHVANYTETLVGACSLFPYSLSESVAEHERRREVARTITTEDAQDYYWEKHWLPILGSSGMRTVVIDCSCPDATPIRVVNWEGPDFRDVRADSLAQVVGWWNMLLETGHWWWAETAWDEDDLAGVDEALLGNGLVG